MEILILPVLLRLAVQLIKKVFTVLELEFFLLHTDISLKQQTCQLIISSVSSIFSFLVKFGKPRHTSDMLVDSVLVFIFSFHVIMRSAFACPFCTKDDYYSVMTGCVVSLFVLPLSFAGITICNYHAKRKLSLRYILTAISAM